MTPDDVLWVLLGAGVLTSVAYVWSELRGHRSLRALEHARLAEQQLLWPGQSKPGHYDAYE
jgi:hypothetical protein